jgi:hypothetical protein
MATETMILKKSIILISRKEIQMEQGEHRTCRRLSTDGYLMFEIVCPGTGSSTNKLEQSLFEDAYLKHDNLADATPIRRFTFTGNIQWS